MIKIQTVLLYILTLLKGIFNHLEQVNSRIMMLDDGAGGRGFRVPFIVYTFSGCPVINDLHTGGNPWRTDRTEH
jgi:hypothetical protein